MALLPWAKLSQPASKNFAVLVMARVLINAQNASLDILAALVSIAAGDLGSGPRELEQNVDEFFRQGKD